MEDFSKKFNKLKNNAKLSKEEKDFHRAQILKFMEKTPSPFSPLPRRISSSFYSGIFINKRYVFAGFTATILLTGGISLGADYSLPNDYLYPIKTGINEPIMVFFTKDKAKIKVDLVERRLEEFSEVALNEEINAKDKAAFVEQLSLQLEDTKEEIAKLKEGQNTGEALKAVNDLQSVLEAQSAVLDKIHEANPETEDTADIESVIDTSIQESVEIENDITDTIINSKDSGNIEQLIEEQKKEIQTTLESIKTNNKEPLLENTPEEVKLDIATQTTIDAKLSEIDRNLKIAAAEEEAGGKIESLELYREIGQELVELQKLIQADQKLKLR